MEFKKKENYWEFMAWLIVYSKIMKMYFLQASFMAFELYINTYKQWAGPQSHLNLYIGHAEIFFFSNSDTLNCSEASCQRQRSMNIMLD